MEEVKKVDTIITSNQYLRQGEFDKIIDWFAKKTNIDKQCIADLMLTWIVANATWDGKHSNMVSSTEQVRLNGDAIR